MPAAPGSRISSDRGRPATLTVRTGRTTITRSASHCVIPPHHAPFAEPRTFSNAFMRLLEPGIGLVIYRAHGFVFPDIRYDDAPENPYQIRRGDLVVLRLGFICRGPLSYGTLWEEALADDPDFATLRARLPEEDCYVPFGAASAVLRWNEGRWWAVRTRTADYLNPWPLLEDFYRSIRK